MSNAIAITVNFDGHCRELADKTQYYGGRFDYELVNCFFCSVSISKQRSVVIVSIFADCAGLRFCFAGTEETLIHF